MKNYYPYTITHSGFTIVELMTVIAIIGILSSIAYPLYLSQSMKKNRVVAISSLLQARAQLEKCFLNNQQSGYNGCRVNISNSVDTKKLYSITPVFNFNSNNIAVSYTLTANNFNARIDSQCSSFSITNTGIKTSAGTGSLQRCWSQ